MNYPLSLKARIVTSEPALKLAASLFQDRKNIGDCLEYKRFLVASYQRSGSTMLTSALNSHPNAICFGEIFNPGRPMFGVHGFKEHSRWLKKVREVHPHQFLSHLVFRGYKSNIRSVGFKLFPDHISNRNFLDVLNELKNDDSVAVIHLLRKNMLAIYLSSVKAKETDAWSSKKNSVQTNHAITLDPEGCKKAFKEILYEQEFFANYFAGREIMTVYYEDIIASNTDKYADIQAYLGLNIERISPKISKQIVRPLSEIIENYNELKTHFVGTEWASNFDES